MATLKSTSLVALALSLSACGVSQAKYDAAVKDANDAKTAAADKQKKLDDEDAELQKLRDQLAAAESKMSDADKARQEELRKAQEAADARKKLFDDFVAKFKKMIDAGHLKIAMRRGRIVLQLHNDVLFDTGKVELKPEGKAALQEIANALKTVRGRRFQVSGHTDIVPIKTKEYPSNWELSMARALNVTKLLIQFGVDANALSAAGYAEYDPVASNNSYDGQRRNRRIEIALQPNMEELISNAALRDAEQK